MPRWRLLEKHERPERCTTEDCWGDPAFQFESGGVGSAYCRECVAEIDANSDQQAAHEASVLPQNQ